MNAAVAAAVSGLDSKQPDKPKKHHKQIRFSLFTVKTSERRLTSSHTSQNTNKLCTPLIDLSQG